MVEREERCLVRWRSWQVCSLTAIEDGGVVFGKKKGGGGELLLVCLSTTMVLDDW